MKKFITVTLEIEVQGDEEEISDNEQEILRACQNLVNTFENTYDGVLSANIEDFNSKGVFEYLQEKELTEVQGVV